MNYENLLSECLKQITEFEEKYKEAIESKEVDESSGMHIVFGYVFTPLLIESLEGNKDLARKMFVFLEEMAKCEDHLVQEVCDCTVMEQLCDEFEEKELLPFLGKHSRESYYAVHKYILGPEQ